MLWLNTTYAQPANYAASIDEVSDDVVQCLTDNTYDLYNCDDGYFDASRVLNSVYITTQNTVTQQAPTPFTMVQPFTASNINNPAVDYCSQVFPFKSLPELNHIQHKVNYCANSIRSRI